MMECSESGQHDSGGNDLTILRVAQGVTSYEELMTGVLEVQCSPTLQNRERLKQFGRKFGADRGRKMIGGDVGESHTAC